jgi:hypothetical protein
LSSLLHRRRDRRDFGSILHTIEMRFGAEPLNDADANAYPMRNLLQP